MKLHTVIGAQTLQDALDRFPGAKFLEMARDIAATHHEWFSGEGYPCGLSGEQIPLCGRIVAVADVYDALTSKRVYKPAQSHEQAQQEIVAESGRHFDPDVVQAFLDCAEEFKSVKRRFAEDGRKGAAVFVPTADWNPSSALSAHTAQS
jgi:putative two-component system response regulator